MYSNKTKTDSSDEDIITLDTFEMLIKVGIY